MKFDAFDTSGVKTRRRCSPDEVYDALRTNSIKLSMYISGEGLQRALFARGVGQYDIKLEQRGRKLICTEVLRDENSPDMPCGWSVTDNRDAVKLLRDELARIYKA